MYKFIKYIRVLFPLFLLLYFPPIVGINTIHFLSIWAWFNILISSELRRVFFNYGRYTFIVLVGGGIIIYQFIIMLVNNNTSVDALYGLIMIYFEVIPISFVLVYIIYKVGLMSKFWNILIIVGMVQSFISLLAFFSPSFQKFLLDIYIENGYRDILIFMSSHRLYGFSFMLAYTMPIVQASLALLALYLGIMKSVKYIIFIPFLLISAIINARVSILVFMIGCVLILIFINKMNLKTVITSLVIIVCLFLILKYTNQWLKQQSNTTYEWIRAAIDDILMFFRDKDASSINLRIYFNKSTYILPNSFCKRLFGTGIGAIRGNIHTQSDVGYVNDIWKGGYVFFILKYYSVYYILKNTYKNLIENKHEKRSWILLIYYILSVLLFSNIKGTIVDINEFIVLIYVLYSYSVCLKYNFVEKISEERSNESKNVSISCSSSI